MSWIETIAAASYRWNARRDAPKGWIYKDNPPRYVSRKKSISLEEAEEVKAWAAIRHAMGGKGIGDTGSIVATPEDLAEIGVADPVTRPGRRYTGPPRHAKPKNKEPAVTFRYDDGEPK